MSVFSEGSITKRELVEFVSCQFLALSMRSFCNFPAQLKPKSIKTIKLKEDRARSRRKFVSYFKFNFGERKLHVVPNQIYLIERFILCLSYVTFKKPARLFKSPHDF
jgi:hypothetical protein